VTFDEAFRRLQQGRAYTPRDTGVVRMENRTSDGTEHFFAVNVPDSYDPARRYQVRIQLHGGVGGRATNAPVGNGTVGTLTGAEQIYVVPYAWAEAPWWGTDQVLNLAAIVDREAALQRRRKPGRAVRRVRRRHRCALRSDARDHAVREHSAAQRLHHGARAAPSTTG
jgi:hypothetical protein